MQAVGNLLDVQVGRQEQGLALGDDMGFDAGEGRLTGLLLDNDRQVFGGDAEVRCVEGDLALGLIVAFEQEHELLEQILLFGGRCYLADVVQLVGVAVEHGEGEVPDGLELEGVEGRLQQGLEHIEVAGEGLAVVGEVDDGLAYDRAVQRAETAVLLEEAGREGFGHDDGIGNGFVAERNQLEYLPGRDGEEAGSLSFVLDPVGHKGAVPGGEKYREGHVEPEGLVDEVGFARLFHDKEVVAHVAVAGGMGVDSLFPLQVGYGFSHGSHFLFIGQIYTKIFYCFVLFGDK